MMRTIALIAPLLLLAGCGDKPETGKPETGKEATAAPVASPAPAAIKLRAGKWQATSELVAMEVPGMPPEFAKANIGQKKTFESCITAEQAEKPASEFFTDAKNTDCKTRNFSMTGGKLAATMSCVGQHAPGEMTMTLAGDYTPTSYAATTTMATSGAPGGGAMKVTARTQGKWIGACDAKVAGG